ncbi:MAG: IS256 family transposase [Acidobacteriota bacterium]
MPAAEWVRKGLTEHGTDLLQEMVAVLAQLLMSADVDAICGASYGSRSAERVNRRNGYRQRGWDTRVGTNQLAVPKLRQGAYFREFLLEPRRRAEKALVAAVTEAYVLGVSTRKVDKLVKSMGLEGISKSRVSEMAKDLDERVEAFRCRALDAGPYPFLWLDAMQIKSREGGRVVNVTAVMAIAVNSDGYREVLGVDVITTEDGAGWLSFLRSLVSRGLSGVQLVTSDAHEGLKAAIASALPGSSWQRCRTHFMVNLLAKVPKAAQQAVATLVRSIFAQPDAESTEGQFDQVLEHLEGSFPEAAELLADAREELLAFTTFPWAARRQLWSNNPLERLNKEVRRRTDVVGIFPNRRALIRLVGAVLAEQNDEWAVTRRYMSLEVVAEAMAALPAGAPQEDLLAISA